jgi:hypothetical protein
MWVDARYYLNSRFVDQMKQALNCQKIDVTTHTRSWGVLSAEYERIMAKIMILHTGR